MASRTKRVLIGVSGLVITGLVVASLWMATLISSDAKALSRSTIPELNLTQDQTLVFYYFHGHQRCTSCRTIEAYTKQVLDEAFADELAMGRVQLKVVNVDEPVHGHYIEDYQLVFRSVVVSLEQDGKEVAWARLDGVWSEIKSWRSFSQYMLSQTEKFVRAAS